MSLIHGVLKIKDEDIRKNAKMCNLEIEVNKYLLQFKSINQFNCKNCSLIKTIPIGLNITSLYCE